MRTQNLFKIGLLTAAILLAGCGPKAAPLPATLAVPAGQTALHFQSDEQAATEFTAFFVRYQPAEGLTTTTRARFQTGSGWTPWRDVEVNERDGQAEPFLTGMAITEPATAWQVTLDLAGPVGSELHDISVETADTRAPNAAQIWLRQLAPKAQAATTDLKIIPRSEWGASADWLAYRELPPSTGSGQPSAAWQSRIAACNKLVADYPAEFADDGRSVTEENGVKLMWPRTYSKNIARIVLHHTDTEGAYDRDLTGDGKVDSADAAATVRAIYRFHALTRAWGDIGYNFLVDQFGNVYEGRSGGDRVIAAHVYCANTGTIGIALIGDYENTTPPRVQLDAAARLAAQLSQKYGLDPAAVGRWHGKDTPTIVGHRDYGGTACPGKNLYAQLPAVRTQVVADLAELQKVKAVADAAAVAPQITAELLTPEVATELATGETGRLTVTLKNTGNRVWSQAEMSLQRLPARPSRLATATWPSPISPANLREDKVAPGELGHFDVPVAAVPARVTEQFTPILKGVGRVRSQSVVLSVSPKKTAADTASTAVSTATLAPAAAPATPAVAAAATTPPPAAKMPNIRIRLGFASDRVEIGGGNLRLLDAAGAEKFRGTFVDFAASKLADGQFFRVEPVGDTILQITNWQHTPAWNPKINDNRYRGALEIRKLGTQLGVINELPLEDYIRGIAEPVPSDPPEKAKLLAVLARSYALYYVDPTHRKFPGTPYDGSDNPAEFQKYLGYNYELRGNMPAAAEATRGVVATFDGKVVKTPYFTSSGGRTRTAAEAKWKVADFPFVVSVEDPWSCGGTLADSAKKLRCPENARGHGVGASGTGMTGLARAGQTYAEILEYFYDGLKLEKAY